ncbi:MAG TPA: glycosyltransferase 87 family protein [Terracidiphilus sp.]|nr:glycosyltransferase 87 family protein [Terracidiphilus sp.]
MSNAQRDGLYLMLIGTLVFVLLGIGLTNATPAPMADFKAVYFPARTLLAHHDPYIESEVAPFYEASRAGLPREAEKIRMVAIQAVYPPTAFFLTVPFAMLPWKSACVVWIILMLGGFIAATWLIWNLCADESPVVAGALIAFLLVNSMLLPITANAAGLAISLSVVAVWCFLRDRFVLLGVMCLAISLAFKPHDAGPVWLCLLLAGPVFRKRALESLLATVVLSISAILWVGHLAPHWFSEMSLNIATPALPGGLTDPGAASQAGHGLDMVITLQTVFSTFINNPRFYNPAAYLVCGPLLLAWIWFMLRRRGGNETVWLGLAAIVPLSMLPIYHRQLDCAMLLLAVPACVDLMKRGDRLGKLALPVTWIALILTGTLYWAIFFAVFTADRVPKQLGWLRADAEIFPVPLVLLATGCFYLWALARRECAQDVSQAAA